MKLVKIPVTVLVLTIQILCTSVFGAASKPISLNGEQFNRSVDLTDQFEPNVPRQQGATCTAYSSIQLMEAACYRRTHQHVKLSDNYLIYENIREKLNKNPNINLVAQPLTPSFLINWQLDTGLPADSLEYFFNHHIITDAEFSKSETFFKLFFDLRKIPNEQGTSASDFVSKLDDFISTIAKEKKLAASFDASKGVNIETSDPTLKQCFENSAYSGFEDTPTPKKALELLNAGIPFVCSSPYFKGQDGVVRSHAFVVSGYRHKGGFFGIHKYADNIEYKIRDSLTGTTHWGAGLGAAVRQPISGCDSGFSYISDTPTN